MTGPEQVRDDTVPADLVRAALEARAATATVDPDAWNRLLERRSRAGRVAAVRRQRPMLTLVAAAVALVLLGMVLGPSEGPTLRTGGTAPPTTLPEPGPEGTRPLGTVLPPQPVPPGTVSPEPAVTPGNGPGIRGVDLANATYPTTLCPEGTRPPGATVTLRDGSGPAAPSPGDPVVSLKSSAYGDMTGDGQEEVAVIMYCGPYATDDIDHVIAVLTERDGAPAVLATRTSPGVEARGEAIVGPVDPRGDVTTRAVTLPQMPTAVAVAADGGVVVTWFQGGVMAADEDAHGTYEVDVTYRWDGRGLALAAAGERRLQPAPDPTPGTLAHHAIRRAGVRSMTVPVGGAPDDRTRLCADVFAPSMPPRDVTLTDGSASVPDAGGAGVTGTVRIDDVVYAPVVGPAEDAVVVVTCLRPNPEPARPGAGETLLALVRLVDGRPVLVDVVRSPPGNLTVTGLALPAPGSVSVTWADPWPGAWPAVVTYRWDGARLVPG